MNREFLDPGRKLVDETADWLCGSDRYDSNVRQTPEGAKTLAHILIVVPTAQSGRNLRLAIAKKAAKEGVGAILPPKIAMASELLVPADMRIATEAEELSAMAEVLMDIDITGYKALFPKPPAERGIDWALDMAGVFLDIGMILGEAALLMSEVKSEIDLERWRDLARLEKIFIARLEAEGITSRSVARRAAVAAGCREKGIEEIVLPSAVDVQHAFTKYLENSSQAVTVLVHAREDDVGKFDDWGRPVCVFAADIGPEMIESLPTAVVEADEIAKYFRSVGVDDALPALAVCDAEMYPELEGAFQNHFSEDELVLRNPSRESLSKSSFGRLLGAIVRLDAERDYETFSTLVRTGDVARWAGGALGVTTDRIAEYTGALDAAQNEHLPQTLDETITAAALRSQDAWSESERAAAEGLKQLAEAVKAEIDDPFGFLKKIFASIVLDEKCPADRELIAAAGTVRDLRQACASEAVPIKFRRKIFARLLKNASYMLEPTARNVLATTGWLEVPWCFSDEVVFAGFNEGCVPANTVGHPFVPDSLRAELGISSNASREARDSFIFAEAVACRTKGAVQVYLHQIAGDKNVMKPSRILFNGISDADLPTLARRLYALTKGNEGAPAKELPPAWRLKLPLPPEGTVFREKMSPTALDQYIRCPFNFYLQEVFGRSSDDRARELDAMVFGNLCHSALEGFAKNGPKDSEDSEEIVSFLTEEINRLLMTFGANLPAVIELQGEAAIERLRAFSVIQARRRKAGWRIAHSEQTLECRIKGCPTLLRGKVDRIDLHEKTGDIAIIDYKTWGCVKEEYYKNSKQLPIYRAMVEASGLFDPVKARSAKAFYCVLGERPEDVVFDEKNAFHEGDQSKAEDEIVGYLTSIAKGIFYPPKKASGSNWAWQNDYGSLIWQSPDEGVDITWLKDQASRLNCSK